MNNRSSNNGSIITTHAQLSALWNPERPAGLIAGRIADTKAANREAQNEAERRRRAADQVRAVRAHEAFWSGRRHLYRFK